MKGMSYFETGILKYLKAKTPIYPYKRMNKKKNSENVNPNPLKYETMEINKSM